MGKYNQLSRYGAITRTLPPTMGKVFFVANGSDTFVPDLLDEFPVDEDGVPRVYVSDSTNSDTTDRDDLAIQAALNACVAGRDDYVIVLPSSYDYNLGAKLTMTKRSVHLIGMNPIHQDRGAGNGVKMHMIANDDMIYVTGETCEIAGFYFKEYNNQSTIVIGAVAGGIHIHHNHFGLFGTTIAGVCCIDGQTYEGASFVLIEKNTFASTTSDLTFASIIDIGDSCTWAKVSKNSFMIGDDNTITIVINCGSYKGQVNDNDIMVVGSNGETATIVNAITIMGGNAFGNRMAIAGTTGQDLAGGCALAFVDNRDANAGGSLAFTN